MSNATETPGVSEYTGNEHATEDDVGKVVRPNHRGEDFRGDVLDWTVYRGRLVRVWDSPGRNGEPVGRVVWFRDARDVFGPYTDGYPLRQLEVAG